MENYAMMRNKRAFQNANPFPSTSSIGGVGSLHESVAQPTLRYFRPSASHCRTWNVSHLSILDKDPLVLQLRHIRAYKAMVSASVLGHSDSTLDVSDTHQTQGTRDLRSLIYSKKHDYKDSYQSSLDASGIAPSHMHGIQDDSVALADNERV
jgi:hypothetical protein